MKFKINKEYEKLNPPLADKEYEKLKKSVEEKGIEDTIKVLKDWTIIDGHHRWKIWVKDLKNKEDDIPSKVIDYLKTEYDIKKYIILSNFERRNLTTELKIEQARKLEEIERDEAKQRQLATLKKGEVVPDKEKLPERGQSRDKLGELAGVSGKTYEHAVEIMDEEPEQWKLIKKGKTSINKVWSKRNAKKKKEKKKKEIRDKLKDYKPDNDIQIIHGDFREKCKDIKDNSVDLILTDPPYPEEYLPLWEDLAKIAQRVLKPGKFCIAYCGHIHLDKVMEMMKNHLDFYWIACLLQKGMSAKVNSRNVICEWKPVLIFYKPPMKIAERTWRDVLDHGGREKGLHDWQQGEDDMKYLLDFFSDVGDLVLEPMAGSGTVPKICKDNKRKCIAIDDKKENIDIIKGRLSELIS